MKDHPKFDSFFYTFSTKNDRAVIGIGNIDESKKEDKEECKRPIGGKRMKEQVGKAELTPKDVKVAAQALKAQKERIELFRFTSTVDNSEPVISEYIKINRRQAPARLKADESTSSQMKTPSRLKNV